MSTSAGFTRRFSLLQAMRARSKGALSKHLFELIEEGKVASERGVYKGRRTTIYSILKEGRWESRRIRLVKILEGFKLPFVYEKKDKDDRFLISVAFEFQDQTPEEKERLEEWGPKILDNVLMRLALKEMLKNISSQSNSKMALTIYYGPEPIE